MTFFGGGTVTATITKLQSGFMLNPPQVEAGESQQARLQICMATLL